VKFVYYSLYGKNIDYSFQSSIIFAGMYNGGATESHACAI